MPDKPKRTRTTTPGKAARAKLSPRDRMAATAEAAAKRLQQLPAKLKKLPAGLYATAMGLMPSAQETAKALFALTLAIGKLPDDWKPERSPRGNGWTPVAGGIVQIREKRAALYADVFPPKSNLVVVDIHAAMLGVRAAGATTPPVPVLRAHLQPKPVEPAK